VDTRPTDRGHVARPILDAALVAVSLAIATSVVWLVVVEGAGSNAGDPAHYARIADQVLRGLVPYRDFTLEYPPLALLPLTLPRLVGGDAAMTLDTYTQLLVLQNVAFAIVTGGGVAWLAARGLSREGVVRSTLAYVVLTLTVSPILLWRYDVFPALLATAGLVGVAAGRPFIAGASLGAGALAKVYPAVLVPVLALYYLQRRTLGDGARAAVAVVVTSLAILTPFLVTAGFSTFAFVAFQEARDVEVGSVLAGFAFLGDILGIAEAHPNFGFNAWQVSSPVVDALALPAMLATLLMVIAYGLSAICAFGAEASLANGTASTALARYALAALLLLILTNKVLSPQYLIWLVPFGALVSRYQAYALLAACVLTIPIYPLYFQSLLAVDAGMVAVLNARNAVLLLLFLWLVIPGLGVLSRRSRTGRSSWAAT
jgi:uncharacterized membrane protein